MMIMIAFGHVYLKGLIDVAKKQYEAAEIKWEIQKNW